MLNCYQRYLFVLLASVTLQRIFTVIISQENDTLNKNEITFYFISLCVGFIIHCNSTNIYLLRYFLYLCVPIYF